MFDERKYYNISSIEEIEKKVEVSTKEIEMFEGYANKHLEFLFLLRNVIADLHCFRKELSETVFTTLAYEWKLVDHVSLEQLNIANEFLSNYDLQNKLFNKMLNVLNSRHIKYMNARTELKKLKKLNSNYYLVENDLPKLMNELRATNKELLDSTKPVFKCIDNLISLAEKFNSYYDFKLLTVLRGIYDRQLEISYAQLRLFGTI